MKYSYRPGCHVHEENTAYEFRVRQMCTAATSIFRYARSHGRRKAFMEVSD